MQLSRRPRSRASPQTRPDVMQVLLRRDVKGLGRRGDIVTVSSGHARNYLIPNGLAVEASEGTIAQAAAAKKSRALQEAADVESARAIAGELSAAPIVVTAKAGASGKLFGSVTAGDVVEAVQRQCRVTIDRKHVVIETPIRELGTHRVVVTLYGDVRAQISVLVQSA